MSFSNFLYISNSPPSASQLNACLFINDTWRHLTLRSAWIQPLKCHWAITENFRRIPSQSTIQLKQHHCWTSRRWKQWRIVHKAELFVCKYIIYIYINIWGFPKMVVPQQPWVFLLKMIILGCWGGYHHFRKHPYIFLFIHTYFVMNSIDNDDDIIVLFLSNICTHVQLYVKLFIFDSIIIIYI